MSQGQETRGEYSPKPQKPTSVVNLLEDDGPYTPECATTPETEKTERDEQTQRERRTSLDAVREGISNQNERPTRQLHDTQ